MRGSLDSCEHLSNGLATALNNGRRLIHMLRPACNDAATDVLGKTENVLKYCVKRHPRILSKQQIIRWAGRQVSPGGEPRNPGRRGFSANFCSQSKTLLSAPISGFKNSAPTRDPPSAWEHSCGATELLRRRARPGGATHHRSNLGAARKTGFMYARQGREGGGRVGGLGGWRRGRERGSRPPCLYWWAPAWGP